MGVKRANTTVTSSLISSVTEMIKDFVRIPDDVFDSNPDIIVFDDCVLELTTGKTRPHSPSDYVTSKLPFKYDPTAHSQEWDDFLETTVPESREFLQRFVGLCMTPETKYETALWLWGPPGGGKSTFIRGVEVMLGSKCGVLGLHEIERSSFALTSVIGKTLLVATESSNVIQHAHLINAMISGEMITIDRKHIEAVSYVPRAKIIWAMNELPPIEKDGVGLFRRVVPVHFPGVMSELRDPKVKEAIANAGPAIFNWALVGLNKVRAENRLEIPPHLVAAQGVYREANNTVAVFLEECCEVVEPKNTSGHYQKTQSQTLFTSYQDWCRKNRRKAMNIKTFGAEMLARGFQKKPLNGRENWIGVVLSGDSEFEVLM